jgi:hypothetical protein
MSLKPQVNAESGAMMGPSDSDNQSKSSQTPDPAPAVMIKPEHHKTSIFRTVVSQLFGLGWIGVIVALLVINYIGWRIGASVGCGVKKSCDYDPFTPDAFKRAAEMDKKDHNILGALQFVAKALEVWFMVLAASLVYDLTMLLAAKGDGLPLGYLMTHVEFTDVLALGERTFWASANPKNHGGWLSRRAFLLYGFVSLVAINCIIANLMGPAAAVLVLPTLGWAEIDFKNTQQFAQSGVADPPRNISVAFGCTDSALAAHNYTCTNIYSGAVDAFSGSLLAGQNQSQTDQVLGSIIPGISQEGLVSFAFNFTDPNGGFWVPSRQVLRELSDDYAPYTLTKISSELPKNYTRPVINETAVYYYNRTIDQSLYDSYRNSLQAVLHRQGPTINLNGFCYRGNSTLIEIEKNKSVRCFNGSNYWTDFPVKCIKQGSAWNTYDTHADFSIGETSGRNADGISVNVYGTNQAVYIDTANVPCTMDQNSPDSQNCDWNTIFGWDIFPEMKNMSLNQQIIQYTLSGSNASVWCDSIGYLNFTDYTLDPSPITNFLSLIGTDTPGNVSATEPIDVHPDWLLAAWSTTRSGTVDPERAVAQNVRAALASVVNSVPPKDINADDSVMDDLVLQHFFILGHGLTMIDYNTTIAPNGKSNDPAHPVFKVALDIRVWAYGLGSRTAKLGAIVAIIGVIVVIMRSVVSIMTRFKRKRTLELFATALEYHQANFGHLSTEKEINAIRFRANPRTGGELEFVPHEG